MICAVAFSPKGCNRRLRLDLRRRTLPSSSGSFSVISREISHKFITMDDAKLIKDKHLSLLLLGLDNLRLNGILTDVYLVHCEANYPANKIILAASSKYFLDLFSVSEVDIPDQIEISEKISPRAIQALIKFCYTGNIEVVENDKEFLDALLYASTELKFDLVTQHCLGLLTDSLTADNFYIQWELASQYDNEGMKIHVCNLMAKEFTQVQKSPDFLKVDVDCLKAILKSEELVEAGKDMVFNAVLNWVQENEDDRLDNLKELLLLVKLDAVSLDCLEDVEDDYESLIDNSKDLRKMVNKEIKLRYRDLRKNNFQPPAQVQTKTTEGTTDVSPRPHPSVSQHQQKIETPLVTIAETTTPKSKPVHNGYDRVSDGKSPTIFSCTDCISKDVTKSNVGASGDNFQGPVARETPVTIMMVKVTDKNSSVQLFNTFGEKVSDLMTVEGEIDLHYHAAVCHDADYAYFVGGRDYACEVQSSFYKFGLKSKEWEKLENMTVPRWGAGVTSMNGFVYVVGGIGSLNQRLCSAERYNSENKCWEELPNMNLCRERPAVIAHGQRLYVIGGYTVAPDQGVKREMVVENTATCEIYDHGTRHWTKLPSRLPLGREIKEKSFLVTAMERKIYAVHVASPSDNVNLHDYNVQLNYWKSSPICDKKCGPWLTFDYVGNKQFYLVDANGNIFEYVEGKRLKQISFENGNGPRATYSIVY